MDNQQVTSGLVSGGMSPREQFGENLDVCRPSEP